ncbi:hypothetical protein FW764_17250 [Pseudomonas sp. 1152_12]
MSISCYGGCAREIFGSAGCLGDRFANLRTAATPLCLATCCGGPLSHLVGTPCLKSSLIHPCLQLPP